MMAGCAGRPRLQQEALDISVLAARAYNRSVVAGACQSIASHRPDFGLIDSRQSFPSHDYYIGRFSDSARSAGILPLRKRGHTGAARRLSLQRACPGIGLTSQLSANMMVSCSYGYMTYK